MPSGIAADGNGSFLLCDMRNYRIRRIRLKTEPIANSEIPPDEENEEIPIPETEQKHDKSKMKPDTYSYLMRRPQKPPEETWYRKLKRRKARRKEREDLGVGYVDLPDEVRQRPSYPKPKPGSTVYNKELGRMEFVENYKVWR